MIHIRNLSIILIIIFGSCAPQVDYETIATYQDHSLESLELEADKNTRVLLIFPHADDETVVAGLTEHLREKGATIHLLTLTHPHDTSQTKVRMDELACCAKNLGFANVEVSGLINNTWDNILGDQIEFWYDHQDSIKGIIKDKIDRFQPQILITYDTEIGGYGHPEHYISARLTEDLFHEYRQDSTYAPKVLLQSTLTEQLEQFLAAKVESYEITKAITGSDGLPDPEVVLDIQKYWPAKNRAAQCYQSQARTLRKFFVTYEEQNAEEHIRAFSKEYYTFTEKE